MTTKECNGGLGEMHDHYEHEERGSDEDERLKEFWQTDSHLDF